jgi:hypothetical protein
MAQTGTGKKKKKNTLRVRGLIVINEIYLSQIIADTSDRAV